MKKICKTVYLENAVDENEAANLFWILKETIPWEEGIRSKKGFTRKAKSLSFDENFLIQELVINTLNKITKNSYLILGIYLNYYENGKMFTPNHSHQGSHQLVISLGGRRTLNVGKKSYPMKNGDAIIFGSSIHGVPKEDTEEERISIATFMTPL
jgi:hypothetical protein